MLSRMILIVGLSFGFLATLHTPVQAQSSLAQQYLQAANHYDQLAAQYARQGDNTTAQRYRQTANWYRQLAAQAGKQKPPPQVKPTPVKPPQPQQPSWSSQVAQARQAALNQVARTKPGRNGYAIYWQSGPIYQGQSGLTATRISHVRAYEVTRYINMLANNNNKIVKVVAW